MTDAEYHMVRKIVDYVYPGGIVGERKGIALTLIHAMLNLSAISITTTTGRLRLPNPVESISILKVTAICERLVRMGILRRYEHDETVHYGSVQETLEYTETTFPYALDTTKIMDLVRERWTLT